MTLEDFEKSLAAEQAERPAHTTILHDGRERKRRKHDHRKDPGGSSIIISIGIEIEIDPMMKKHMLGVVSDVLVHRHQ